MAHTGTPREVTPIPNGPRLARGLGAVTALFTVTFTVAALTVFRLAWQWVPRAWSWWPIVAVVAPSALIITPLLWRGLAASRSRGRAAGVGATIGLLIHALPFFSYLLGRAALQAMGRPLPGDLTNIFTGLLALPGIAAGAALGAVVGALAVRGRSESQVPPAV